jgi:hypothetical protein
MLNNVPQGVCARLLTASSGSDYVAGGPGATTVVSSGFIRSGVRAGLAAMLPDYQPYAMNPTQAGWMCKYGGANYTNKTQQPNTTPISGNVAMAMFFLVEALRQLTSTRARIKTVPLTTGFLSVKSAEIGVESQR